METNRTSAMLVTTADLIVANLGAVALVWAVLGLIGTLFDRTGALAHGALFVNSLVSLIAQFWLTGTLLGRLGLAPAERGRTRLFALFGMNLVSGIAILIGFVLLIVPGLYLAARWIASAPILIGEQADVGDALGRSWRETAPLAWPIAASLVAIWLPAIVVGGVAAYASGDGLVGDAISNAATAGAAVAGWCLAVSVFRRIGSDLVSLEEVFA